MDKVDSANRQSFLKEDAFAATKTQDVYASVMCVCVCVIITMYMCIIGVVSIRCTQAS